VDWEKLLHLDTEQVTDRLTHFIREQTGRAGVERLVIGLSGGLDSATSSALAVRALGAEKVTAIIMPYRTSTRASSSDAEAHAGSLGIDHHLVDISPMVDAYFANSGEVNAIRRGNMMARQRMAILFDYSARLQALVLGTGNKTEAMLGYTTIYGDNACALNPLGDLLKTQVRQLARHLGVARRILEKPPSADLWQGQTDEGELGLTYEIADRILHCLCHQRLAAETLTEAPFMLPAAEVERVVRLIRRNRFKRILPPLARITPGEYEPEV